MIPSISHQLEILEHTEAIKKVLAKYEHTRTRFDKIDNLMGKLEDIKEIIES